MKLNDVQFSRCPSIGVRLVHPGGFQVICDVEFYYLLSIYLSIFASCNVEFTIYDQTCSKSTIKMYNLYQSEV